MANPGTDAVRVSPLADSCMNGLTRLQRVIDRLDEKIAADKAAPELSAETYARLVFARNTLAVNAKFWAEDVLARLERRSAVLGPEEGAQIHRRLGDSFLFALTELAGIGLDDLTDILDQGQSAARAFSDYVAYNAQTLAELAETGARIVPPEIDIAGRLAPATPSRKAA